MLPASRDIWQGHPSTQAWKVHQQEPGSITDLHQAAWNGDESSIQYLLDQGQQVDASDQQGRTLLHSAAIGNRPGAIKLLLQRKANLHAVASDGNTALHAAAAQGSTAAIQALLAHGADPTATNAKAQTPLYLAADHQHPAAIQLLCQAAPAAVNRADEWGLTPLHMAARAGSANAVQALLRYQADPMLQSWDQRTALHFAALHRHPAVIRQLLMHPALRLDSPTYETVPNPTPDTMQQTQMHDSPSNSHATAAVHGSMVTDQDQDMTAAEHNDSASQLTENNALPAQHGYSHDAGLHPSAEEPPQNQGGKRISEDDVRFAASSLQSLHSAGQQNHQQNNPSPNPSPDPTAEAQMAADMRQQLEDSDELDYTAADSEAMDALLALTSDFSLRSPPKLQAPADHFLWQKHLLSLKDHQGNAALHLAVIEGVQESVQLLLQAGADTATPGMQQQTPLKMAQQFEHKDVAQMLIEAGAL